MKKKPFSCTSSEEADFYMIQTESLQCIELEIEDVFSHSSIFPEKITSVDAINYMGDFFIWLMIHLKN